MWSFFHPRLNGSELWNSKYEGRHSELLLSNFWWPSGEFNIFFLNDLLKKRQCFLVALEGKCFNFWKSNNPKFTSGEIRKGRLLHCGRVSWLGRIFQCTGCGGDSHWLSNHCHLQAGNAKNSSQIKRAAAQIGSQISRLSRISAAQPSRAPVNGGEMISWHFHNHDHVTD